MAIGKNTEHDFESSFEKTKRFFDGQWREKFGGALPDWIVNLSKTPDHIRLLACFATPDVCRLEGNKLVFFVRDSGVIGSRARQCKQLWEGNFITTLQDVGLSVFQEPEEKALKWDDMDSRQKMGFAKAIWIKRDFIGREIRGLEKIPFESEIQFKICRLAGAPHPNYMKTMLENNSIEIGLLEAA